MKLNIAIIGSGIAGLSAARMLSEQHDVTLFEKKSQLGLGSEGIEVSIGEQPVRVDVPPRVINEIHYPNLFQLLRDNQVQTYPIYQQPSFSNADGKIAFSLWSGQVNLPFIGKRFFTLPKLNWTNVKWLSRHGIELLRWLRLLSSRTYLSLGLETQLRPWLESQGFSKRFIDEYLYSIWSLMCSANQTELDAYPARSMAQLFHHFSGFSSAQRIRGGTKALEKALIQNVKTINLNAEVISVTPNSDGTAVRTTDGEFHFDHVILATEPAIANTLLSPHYQTEKALLSQVPYRTTEMVMHTDERLMPQKKSAWSAVNMMRSQSNDLWATVWMNPIETKKLPFNLFQSWDPIEDIDSKQILARRQFHRSLLTPESAKAMDTLVTYQKNDVNRRLWLIGSYLTSQVPLLEDGVRSAKMVAERINLTATKTPLIDRPAA